MCELFAACPLPHRHRQHSGDAPERFVLIVALYVTLERVNRNLALLGLILHVPESVLGLLNVLIGLRMSQIVSSEASLLGFSSTQVQTLVQVSLRERFDVSTVVLVFLALGSLPFLYLFWTARYAPRPLVGFGMLTYLLALVSAFASILAPGSAVDRMQTVLVLPVMVFELMFGVWLAIRSIEVPLPEHPGHPEALTTGLPDRTAAQSSERPRAIV